MGHEVNKLYEELGDLARFVENAMRTIAEAGRPIMSSSAQLPTTTSHLTDLSRMTEEGTLEVMRLTELIQDNRARAAKECAAIEEALRTVDCVTLAKRIEQLAADLAQDDRHLVEIMTALSFQDLVAQRVKKLVTILDDVQEKLLKLVVVFGLQGKEADAADSGRAGEALKQLEQTRTGAMKQNVADGILAQFGFK